MHNLVPKPAIPSTSSQLLLSNEACWKSSDLYGYESLSYFPLLQNVAPGSNVVWERWQ